MATEEVDVVVVGAGLSGLTAARYLVNKDPSLHVIVLEGKDRVGGRTQTVSMKTVQGTGSFDLGAQWVGRSQTHVMALIEELGLETYEQYTTGTKCLQLGNKIRKYESDIPTLSPLALLDLHRMMTKIDRMSEQIDTNEPFSCPDAESLDSMTFKTFLDQTVWTKDAMELAKAAFRGIIGVETSQISALFMLTYVASAGGMKNLCEATPYAAQEYRIKGGTQQISEIMAAQLGETEVKLEEAVVQINQVDDEVLVKTNKGQIYKCKKVILSTPPPQTGKILFEPSLPTINKELVKRMPMSNYTKIIITFKTAFWRTAGLSGEVVTSGGPSISPRCKSGPLCLAFDETLTDGSPALVAFLGGEPAIAWRQEQDEDRRKAVLTSLSEFFGPAVNEYLDYVEKDWALEPYCEGAPVSCVGPGAMEYYAQGLRKPFGRVHFAGTDTATVWCGYMSGAIQAGRRAALEVLSDLRPQCLTAKDLAENQPRRKPSKPSSGWGGTVLAAAATLVVPAMAVLAAKLAYDQMYV